MSHPSHDPCKRWQLCSTSAYPGFFGAHVIKGSICSGAMNKSRTNRQTADNCWGRSLTDPKACCSPCCEAQRQESCRLLSMLLPRPWRLSHMTPVHQNFRVWGRGVYGSWGIELSSCPTTTKIPACMAITMQPSWLAFFLPISFCGY